MRVEHRLSKLEQAIETTYAPRVCIVFGDNADAEAAVAKFRLANSWPDDAAHPVQVVRVCWGKALEFGSEILKKRA